MIKLNLSIIIILLSSNIILFSQDIIDPSKLSQFNDTTIAKREQNQFIRGWTCGTPGNMLDSAMYMNTYYGYLNDWFQEEDLETLFQKN